MPARIFPSLEAYLDHRRTAYEPPIVFTSGGFDLLHLGHCRLLRGAYLLAARLARESPCLISPNSAPWPWVPNLVVAVNGDGFLLRKKGVAVMPLEERMGVVAHVEGVGTVFPYDDGTQFVAGAIRMVRPAVFAKGGDRSTPESIAPCERLACEEVGCRLVLGVGGEDKVNSSSWMTARLLASGPQFAGGFADGSGV